MDLKRELEAAKQKRAEVIDRINQMEQEKQTLLRQAISIEGEIGVWERLIKEKEK